MNRHARRSVAKNKRLVASLSEVSEAAGKLQPLLEQIAELRVELANAAELVSQTRLENEALASALNIQRAVYYRMFAQGMGVSLDTILSMAQTIQAQLTESSQGSTDGIETLRTPGTEEADDSSP